MVACDKCDDWFHVGSCVDKSVIERKKKWYQSICQGNFHVKFIFLMT